MEIIGRNPNPDRYSISDIKLHYDITKRSKGKEKREIVTQFLLLVELQPKPYRRERGFGSSYGPKENPCTLRIELQEIEEIQRKLRRELRAAYQFLMDRNLFDAFERHKEQLGPWSPDDDEPEIY
jgi:hypothetical protein